MCQTMKLLLRYLYFVIISFNVISCSKPSAIQLDVRLDTEKRPLQVISYIIRGKGVKVKHGETLNFDWATGTLTRENYCEGALIDSTFESLP
jgi:hypothetical protein